MNKMNVCLSSYVHTYVHTSMYARCEGMWECICTVYVQYIYMVVVTIVKWILHKNVSFRFVFVFRFIFQLLQVKWILFLTIQANFYRLFSQFFSHSLSLSFSPSHSFAFFNRFIKNVTGNTYVHG